MASIAGAPRPSPWTRLWLRTVVEESIASDPVTTPFGHLTTFAMTADDRQATDEAIRQALAA